MDLANIKKFILSPSDRLIFMEGGEPAVVLMSFSEYQKLASAWQGNGQIVAGHEPLEILSHPEEWAPAEAPETELMSDEMPPAVRTARLDQIRLEDLPL